MVGAFSSCICLLKAMQLVFEAHRNWHILQNCNGNTYYKLLATLVYKIALLMPCATQSALTFEVKNIHNVTIQTQPTLPTPHC